MQAEKYHTFSQLECNGEKVGFLKEKSKNNKKKNVYAQAQKFCVSCGREITHQKGNSRFCSERLYGKEAKRCRNKDSNKRLIIKRQINRAQANGLEVDVTYIDNNKARLKADTIRYNRALFDLMQSVEAVKPVLLMKSKHKCNSKSPP